MGMGEAPNVINDQICVVFLFAPCILNKIVHRQHSVYHDMMEIICMIQEQYTERTGLLKFNTVAVPRIA